MNLLDFIAPATMAGHRARKEAAAFTAGVRPGHTYYSIVEGDWASTGKGRLLMEWTFGKRSWLTGQMMCGHLTATGVWLSYGPIHAERPQGLLTLAEYRRRTGLISDAVLREARPVPAGM